MNLYKIVVLLALIALFKINAYSQSYMYNYSPGQRDTFRYFVGKSDPDPDWNQLTFNDSSWEADTMITIGYGDGDDLTVVDTCTSLYLRFPFNASNVASVTGANLFADFDDGFVAYINGNEICRANMGKSGDPANYQQLTDRSNEAKVYRRRNDLIDGYYIYDTVFKKFVIEGENVLAVEVHNDSVKGSDLSFYCYFVSFFNNYYNFYDQRYRYKASIDIDSTYFPIVVINTDEYGLNDYRGMAPDGKRYNGVPVDAHMGIIDNGPGQVNKPTDAFNGYDGRITIKPKGESSFDFPKRTYRIETQDNFGNNLNVEILGMPAENDWILVGPYHDKSLFRNTMIFDLGRRLGDYQPRTRHCEVILNGELIGLYEFTEKIKRDDDRVNIARLTSDENTGNDVTGGFIFRYDKDKVGRMEIIYPEEDSITGSQLQYFNEYMQHLNKVVHSNDFLDTGKGYKNYVNDTSLINNLIINELTKNADAYIYSFYMYKDRDDRDKRINFGPLWDYDLAFGNTIYQEGFLTNGWQFAYNYQSFDFRKYFQDPELTQMFEDKWFELREGMLSNDSLMYRIDSMANYIKDARIRNYQVWPVIDKTLFHPYYNSMSYEDELNNIKNWLNGRLEWIDNNIRNIYYPLDYYSDIEEPYAFFENDFIIYPNPVRDELNIKFSLQKPGDVTIELVNVVGQKHIILSNEFYTEGSYSINWNKGSEKNFSPGIYFVLLKQDGVIKENLKVMFVE